MSTSKCSGSSIHSKKRLVTPTTFVPLLHQYILKASQCFRSQELQKGDIDDHFYPLVMYKVPCSTMNECQLVGEKLIVRYQLNVSVFNGLSQCYVQQQKFTVRLLSVTNSHGNSLQCFRGLKSMANYPTRWNLFLTQGISLGDTKCLVTVLSSPLYGDLIQIHFIDVYILGSFYGIRPSYGFTKHLQRNCSFSSVELFKGYK